MSVKRTQFKRHEEYTSLSPSLSLDPTCEVKLLGTQVDIQVRTDNYCHFVTSQRYLTQRDLLDRVRSFRFNEAGEVVKLILENDIVQSILIASET